MSVIQIPYNFALRDYQVDPWNAFLAPTFQRGLMVVPRRNGKDLLCWNGLIAKAMETVGLYYYMAPYYNQVRQIIWEGFDGSGRRFLDYIPRELITGATKIDMRIDLINGSQIKLQGSDQIDRIVGTNPRGIVFTEFSLHKPAAWDYLRPILAENGGWAMFNGTPRGLNHFYKLYNQAINDPTWFTQHLTRDDTGIPSLEAIEADRRSGMSEELINQEYYCSWLSGVTGAYYARDIEQARADGRITDCPYDDRLLTYVAWDIGMNDTTALWFYQLHRNEVRFIDYYEERRKGVSHFAKIIKEKPYVVEEHIGPHDLEVEEWGTGITRTEKAWEYGIDFTVLPRSSVEDGIEAGRGLFSRCWFDSRKCERGIAALMNYHASYDAKHETYGKPVHDWSSNGADAFRYAAIHITSMMPLFYEGVHGRVGNIIRAIR